MEKTLKERISEIAKRASLSIQEDYGFMDTEGSRSARTEIIENAIYQSIGEMTSNKEEPELTISRFMEQWKSDCREMSDGEKIKRLAVLVDLYKADKLDIDDLVTAEEIEEAKKRC